jgi:hypothetical protein
MIVVLALVLLAVLLPVLGYLQWRAAAAREAPR